MAQVTEHMTDTEGGFFDTRDDHERLLLRPKDIQDNATPSGNSLAAIALLRLAALDGDGEGANRAEQMLATIQEMAVRYPTAFSKWLCAIDQMLIPGAQLVILGDLNATATKQLIAQASAAFQPNLTLAAAIYPAPPDAPSLLHDRPLQNGQPTAYVCRNFVCLQPVTDVQQLKQQLLEK
jgi:hypothetical protein